MFFKKKKKIDQNWVDQKIGYLYLNLKNELERTRYPLFPLRNFYSEWSANDFSLSVMAQRILSYLNEPMGNLTVSFRSDLGDTPGRFTVEGDREFIFVNSKYRGDPYAVGAILAHEIMHLYLMSRKNVVLKNKAENELLTDLGTIYLGLGVLVINGMSYKSNWFLTVIGLFAGVLYINEQKLTFGYFDPYQYAFYLKEYFKINNIQLKEVAKYIHPKSWHFISGLPLKAKLSKESVFSKEARRKIILNAIGIFIVLTIGTFLFISWIVPYDKSNNVYQKNYGTVSETSKELDKLSIEIDNLKKTIESQEKQLEELSKKLERYKAINDIYNYNNLVPVYNNLFSEYKATINLYNQKVNIYNQSIKNVK